VECPSKNSPPASLVGEFHLNEMLTRAEATPPGCFVEVGVYKGGSAYRLQELAKRQNRALFLYDTFAGIPYESPVDSHHIGDFADVDLDQVVSLFPYARVVKGIFPNSAVGMPGIAFAHIDCDQYQCVFESALYLQPRMVADGVIWFDDSPCLAGARQAVLELYADRVQLSSDHGKHYVEF
jgi:hypothetical protein